MSDEESCRLSGGEVLVSQAHGGGAVAGFGGDQAEGHCFDDRGDLLLELRGGPSEGSKCAGRAGLGSGA